MQPLKSVDTGTPVALESEKYTLRREIRRGWEWVVFVWKMGGRLGGFRSAIRTVFMVLSLLIRRLLVQWGWLRR